MSEKNDNIQEIKEGKTAKKYSEIKAIPDNHIKIKAPGKTAEHQNKIQTEASVPNLKDIKRSPYTPMPEYRTMTMRELVEAFERLVSYEKIQTLKKHVERITEAFDLKYEVFQQQKKENRSTGGGDQEKEIILLKRAFDTIYAIYKEKREQYYKNLEQTVQSNLENRREIIETLKGLITVEEDINIVYKSFKKLQNRWRKAGPVPKANYNDLWRNYRHHVDIFHDFLALNKELKGIDFKKNLEEKEKIIEKAEQLLEEEDVYKAFGELQNLHKIWKEDIGPVDPEHEETLWIRFKEITKTLRKKRQEYAQHRDKDPEQNLRDKEQIIKAINDLVSNPENTPSKWQKQMKEIEALRKLFFNIGRVPHKAKEKVWNDFKTGCNNFNRNKNAFYKKLKREYAENLNKKMELLKIANSLKNSENWKETTPVMKSIQSDWAKIGHVPKKYANQIWKDFKAACNDYFDRLHAQQNQTEKKQHQDLKEKREIISTLHAFHPGDDAQKDLHAVKTIISRWNAISNGVHGKQHLDDKFNAAINSVFKKLHTDKEQAALTRYENKIEHLADNAAFLDEESVRVKRRINELTAAIRQLENNLQFINAKEDNPLVKEVIDTINAQKEDLTLWKAKLKKLKTI